jgi:hypothetical protein
VGIGIAELNKGVKEFYYKEYKTNKYSLEHGHLLALFSTLRIIEEKKLKNAFIYHNASAMTAKEPIKAAKDYPQILSVLSRLERLRKKGHIITYIHFEKKKHKELNSLRQQVILLARTGKKPKDTKKEIETNVIPLPVKNNKKSVDLNTNKIYHITKRIPKDQPMALLDHEKKVIKYLNEREKSRLILNKRGKSVNEVGVRSADSNDISHPDISWINIKQLKIPKWKLMMDALLPKKKRSYTTIITRDGSLSFIIHRSIAERLVKEKAAVYTSPNQSNIMMLFTYVELRNHVFKRDKSTCQYCGKINATTLEHIVPVSKGGLTTPENCIVNCKKCNPLKGNMDIHQFYQMMTSNEKKVAKLKIK